MSGSETIAAIMNAACAPAAPAAASVAPLGTAAGGDRGHDRDHQRDAGGAGDLLDRAERRREPYE